MSPDPYLPTLLDPRNPDDWKRIVSFKNNDHVRVVDHMDEFLRELFAIRHPETIKTGISDAAVSHFSQTIAGDARVREQFGMWVFFPWNNTLVHVLPESLHTELRTSRNRNLVTGQEQQRYYESSVGVAGLSVGNSVVMSLVHTGGAKDLRIADHDVLSGSNTNRIRTGFDSVGLKKSTIVAREVFAVNPYARLTVFDEGVTVENIHRFLTHPAPLQVVIDEMDSLYLKIQLRLAARALRIPVIMAADNGDGIVVDIERYDMNPSYPLMHGSVAEHDLVSIAPDTARPVAAKIISSWVGPENIDSRMKSSLLELGSTLYTWPQLGNAAFMAGAVLSYVARRIILGHPVVGGKVVFNPDALFVPEFNSAKQRQARRKETDMFIKALGL